MHFRIFVSNSPDVCYNTSQADLYSSFIFTLAILSSYLVLCLLPTNILIFLINVYSFFLSFATWKYLQFSFFVCEHSIVIFIIDGEFLSVSLYVAPGEDRPQYSVLIVLSTQHFWPLDNIEVPFCAHDILKFVFINYKSCQNL